MDNLAERLHNNAKNNSECSIYIQTSKDIYELQEDLWFKAYILDSQHNTPFFLDKTLYLQLLQESNNNVVLEEKYEIVNGFVEGHLYLRDFLKSGNYKLIACSSHSIYDRPEQFYALKNIKLVENIIDKKNDSLVNSSILSDNIKSNRKIQFGLFPEGGDLISGLKNTLAFKGIDSIGNPIELTGVLFEDHHPVLNFRSTHDGMGKFQFTPNIRKKYHVQLTDSLGVIDSIYMLPKIKEEGVVIQLKGKEAESVTFKVKKTPMIKTQHIYLRTQTRGMVQNIATGFLKDSLLIKIPTKDYPQGITEVTLFNKDFMPIAERLVYINPNKKINIKVSGLSNEDYVPREKVTLDILTTDEYNKPIATSLCLSVFDKLYRNKENVKDILNHYYLSTQLKGEIYNPKYYFDQNKKNRNQALDLLLLTQGWRRYTWGRQNLKTDKQVLQTISNDSHGNITVINPKDKQKLEPFALFFNSSEDYKRFVELDANGAYTITTKDMISAKAGYLYIKGLVSSDIKINNNVINPFRQIDRLLENKNIIYPKYLPSEEYKNEYIQLIAERGFIVLEEVAIKGKKQSIIRDKYIGKLDSLTRLKNYDYVCREGGVLNCPMHVYNSTTSKKPVEGVQYKKHKALSRDAQKEWVWHGWTLYPPYKSINMLSEEELLKKFGLARIKGYYGDREFYHMNHNKEYDPFPDYRNTLLWKPDIRTDGNGKARVEFYCSDIKTSFIGIIEGVSKEGLLGNVEFSLQVINK